MLKEVKQFLKRHEPRATRIKRIARKLVERADKRRDSLSVKKRRPMRRKVTQSRVKRIIAYDLETTSIKAGTPDLRYITAFGAGFQLSEKCTSFKTLLNILQTSFLTPENKGARFIAWNGNNFDIRFVAKALTFSGEYMIRPYLTRSNTLRGALVVSISDPKLKWEFLDGISMTGLVGRSLEFFLKTYAPDYQKLKAPDWERVEFDPNNKEHVAYAERDSEGLYYAIHAAQKITLEHVGIPLQPTIGNLGIKALMRYIPNGIQVWQPPYKARTAIRKSLMRGGYCYCAKKYHGPVWKYDLNQAYAAAMRETDLPAGQFINTGKVVREDKPGMVRMRATNLHNKIPFYYCDLNCKKLWAETEMVETWLTTSEYTQLKSEGWNITVYDSCYWSDAFRMTEYVNMLENIRVNAPDGPNGATGLMIKAIGNNSYSKSLEELGATELIMAREKPDGWGEYQTEFEDTDFIWFRFREPDVKDYHQPQIGAMITAHVRMVVRRACLKDADNWLYADTDCVMFSRPVDLDIDPKIYGRWKQETNGDIYYVIDKKVYADAKANTKHAKGMNIKRLTITDFEKWYSGEAPVQSQVHKTNFLKFMSGDPMFYDQVRTGTKPRAAP